MKAEDLLFQFRYEVLLSNGKKEFVRYRITAGLEETAEYLQSHGIGIYQQSKPQFFEKLLLRWAKDPEERVYAFQSAPYGNSKAQLIEEVQSWLRLTAGDLRLEVVDIHLCFKCENCPL